MVYAGAYTAIYPGATMDCVGDCPVFGVGDRDFHQLVGKMRRNMIDKQSTLWSFFSPQEKILYEDGMFLLEDSKQHQDQEPTDYSYIVFPFAKLYEGFLKDLFLKLAIISEHDYRSDHFRIGKVLSPNLVRRLGSRSAYGELERRYGKAVPDLLWRAWKEGRNLVFHYFPHNYRVLTRDDAERSIRLLVQAMEEGIMVGAR